MTAAVTLQILLPLVIIMMTFSAFAGEKESGTLRQVLSAGVQPRRLASGKLLGVMAALALLLAPAALLGVGTLSLATMGAQDGLARAAILLAMFGLYLGGWALFCLGVSAWASSSRLALVVLLAFWIGNCLVAPRAMADIASRLHPTGSALERHLAVTTEARQGPDGHNPDDPYWKVRKQELLKQYDVADVSQLPFNFDGLVAVEAEKYSTEVYRRHFREIWGVYARQDEAYRVGGLVAPMLAIQSLSMGLAGTDFAQQRHFAEAAETYRTKMALEMNGYIMNRVTYGDRLAVAGRDLWEQLPDFDYTMPDVGWAMSNQKLSVVVLLAWFAGSFAFAIWRAGRIRPVQG
jgi:ABC-2 type transport system permease protein